LIGVVSILFSLIGYWSGVRFGRIIARRLKPELFGGLVLVFIGIKVLLSHLF
jgi:putative Mn2+ efflux pump MntP